ncbi:hypothetical protein HDU97_003288 [Phlyctochytrium planicorne]|nr:hypothetical protein HDU97_003288 [Phlyctochytrium planicorne]
MSPNEPTSLFGGKLILTQSQGWVALACLATLILYFTAAGSTIFWIASVTITLIVLHAGFMDTPIEADFSSEEPTSRSSILDVIENKKETWTKEEFKKLLDDQGDLWSLVLDGFKPHGSKAKPFKGQEQLKSWEKAFLSKLTAHLNLEDEQCYLIMMSCIRNEVQNAAYRSKNADLDETHLLDKVTIHYFEEREAAIQLIGAFIRISTSADEGYVYYEPINDFVTKLLSGAKAAEFATRIRKQFQKTISQKIPSHVEMNASDVVPWSRQYLLEQRSLLNLLFLLHYDAVSSSAKDTLELLELFHEYKFGLVQANSPLFDETLHELVREVSFLCGLVVVTVLDCEKLLDNGTVDGMDADNNLLVSSDKQILQITEILASYSLPGFSANQDTVIGLLLLAWGSFLQKVPLAKLQSHQIPRDIAMKLVQASSNVKVFHYIENCLREFCKPTNVAGTAYRSVMKGLLNLFSCGFTVGNHPEFEQIAMAYSAIFEGFPDLSIQFWLQDYPLSDRRAFLDSARRRFPLETRAFIRLCSALSNDSETARYLYKYLSDIKTYAAVINVDAISRARDGQYLLKADYPILTSFASGNTFVIPAMTPVSIKSTNSSTEAMVLFKFSYSVFQLISSVVEAYLGAERLASVLGGGINSLSAVTDLIGLFYSIAERADAQLFQDLISHIRPTYLKDDSAESYPSAVIELFCRVLSRSCDDINRPPTQLIKTSVKILSLFIPYYPQFLWPRLRELSILPKYGQRSFQSTTPFPSNSYLQNVLLPYERSMGTYEVTLAFLQFVSKIVANDCHHVADFNISSIRIELIESCITFVQSEVFTNFGTWRYSQILQKFEIANAILGLFNQILTSCFASYKLDRYALSRRADISSGPLFDPSELWPIRDFLVKIYLTDSSIYQLSPLLDILAAGNNGPETLYNSGKISEGRVLESTIIASLKFTNGLLRIRKVYHMQPTLLEHALLDRTVQLSGRREVTELMNVIGSYVTYQYNFEVPYFATQTQTLLCSIASEWEPRPPSFIGYFGSNATTIVAALIDLMNREEDIFVDDLSLEDMQASILNLVCVVIKTQPGLGTIFLHGGETYDEKGKKPSTKETFEKAQDLLQPKEPISILEIVLKILNDWKTVLKEKCLVLLAGTRLLEILWSFAAEHQLAIEKIRASEKFWDRLADVLAFDASSANSHELSAKELTTLLNVKASICRILAYDAYFQSHKLNLRGPASAKDVKANLSHFSRFLNVNVIDRLYSETRISGFDLNLRSQLSESCQDILGFELECLKSLTCEEELQNGDPTEFHLFDAQLLSFKMRNIAIDSKHREFFRQMCKVNEIYAVSEQRLHFLAGVTFFVKSFSLKMESLFTPQIEMELKLFDRNDILKVLPNLFKAFFEERVLTDVHIEYFAHIASSIMCLLRTAFSQRGKNDFKVEKVLIAKAIDFAKSVLAVLSGEFIAMFRLNESIAAIIGNLCGSMLLILQYLLSKVVIFDEETNIKELKEFLATIFPPVSELLGRILSNESVIDSTLLPLSLSLISILTDSLRLIFCLGGEDDNDWLTSARQFAVFPNILKLIANMSVASEEGLAKIEDRPVKVPLQLILLAVSNPASADVVIDSGLISSFSALSLSDDLSDGLVVSTQGSERSGKNEIWCIILSVLAEALLSSKNPSFTEACIGYIKRVWKQIERSLEISLQADISVGSLDELARITQLLYSLHVGMSNGGASQDWDFLHYVHEGCVRLLDGVVFLLSHPTTLSRRMVAIERDRLSQDDMNDVLDQKDISKIQELELILFSILRNLTCSICLFSDIEQALVHRSFGAEFHFYSPITQNALMESLSYVVDLMKRIEKSDAKDTRKAFPSPSSLALVSTQTLAIIAVQGKVSSGDRRELTELVQQVILGLVNLRGLGDEGATIAKQAVQEVKDIERFFVRRESTK